ncbi:hypothetical protein [Entomobacter blattae]|nr:hypothetical protein [Entomobacter blattae]
MASLPIGYTNAAAEQTSHEFRKNYPLQIALDAMGKSFQDSVTHLNVTQHVNKGESPDKAVVTIEESELLDDSVAAEKTVFTMNYRDGKWQIMNRIQTQQCRPNRGHQNFSNQPCH